MAKFFTLGKMRAAIDMENLIKSKKIYIKLRDGMGEGLNPYTIRTSTARAEGSGGGGGVGGGN